MRTLRLLELVGIALIFSQCKSPTQVMQSSPPSLLEVHAILDSAQAKFIQYADQTNGDPAKAIELTTDWLLLQPNVRNAVSLDSTYISIELNSGLHTTFSFLEVDDSGHTPFRGGGGGDILEAFGNVKDEILSSNTILNKKVLLYATDTKTLPAVKAQLQRTYKRLTNSGLGLDVSVFQDEQCTYGLVETFKDYGLVLIDGHGVINGFYVGSTLDLAAVKTDDDLKSAVDAQAGAGTAAKLLTGQLALATSVKGNLSKANWQKSVIPTKDRTLLFTSEYIQLLPPMPNTVIFGNMCESGFMATTVNVPARTVTLQDGTKANRPSFTFNCNPIGKAFVDRKPISYYGYARDFPVGTSRGVPDDFAATMEDTLVTRLVVSIDSTEIANLKRDNNTEYSDPPHLSNRLYGYLSFRHFGANDYSYQKCGDSILDSRDGQKYATVCIGKQSWMAQNLNYDVPGSMAYDNDPANAAIYGRLYNWNALMQGGSLIDANPSGVRGICPKGWHVPSQPEWLQLSNFISPGTPGLAGGAMKSVSPLWTSPNVGATNSSGFSALPGGYYVQHTDSLSGRTTSVFGNIHVIGAFWSASLGAPGYYAIDDLFNYDSNLVFPGALIPSGSDNGFSLPCRCVKDP
jgi:uncharacterized protein (TIGR02145 family)